MSATRVFAEHVAADRWLVCDGEAQGAIIGEIVVEHERFVPRLWDSADEYSCASCGNHDFALLYFEDYLAALEIGT